MIEETPEDPLVEDLVRERGAGVGLVDEAHRALEESGEGEAEGFELAEEDLIEEASHGNEGRSPEADAFTPEVESDEAGSVYGEGDEVDPTEVVSDPREDDDDPGAGPGLAADR